jgi:hypothetical protein
LRNRQKTKLIDVQQQQQLAAAEAELLTVMIEMTSILNSA